MGKFEESLVHDVIPYIESNYRVLTKTENRAIAGLSMGGGHTAKTVFNNPGLFSYIGVFSGASINPSEDQLKGLKDKKPKFFWIGCGVEDRLLPGSKTLSESLNKFAIKNIYRETPGGHTWRNWRVYLSEITPLLFKDL
jgi:enterochelin esterase family protein